jgi:selenocysteine-specific elongation factor
VRVRGLQTYGKSVKTAHAGQRTAVNLGGIEHAEIERGMMLSEKNILRPTQIFDAEIEVLKEAKRSLKSRQRVRVHIGTIEALARVQVLNEGGEVQKGEKDFVQLRLETSIAAIPNERFIIRSYSPQITIAGGRVLDALAQKHRRKDIENIRKYLQNLIEAENDKARQIKLYLETANENGLTFADLQARSGLRTEILQKAIVENIGKKAVIEAESFLIARTPFENLKTKTFQEIENHHNREPLARGILRETLRERVFAYLPLEIFKSVLENLEKAGKIKAEKYISRLAAKNIYLSNQ